MYSISFEDYKNNFIVFRDMLGVEGFIMFTENRAIVCYEKYPNIRIKIEIDKYFQKNDFKDFDNLRIIGKGKKELDSPFKMLQEDLKNNITKVIVTLIIYVLIIFIFTKDNLSIIININEKIIDITGIYIGMVFVFIGFFYGDKERTIDVYKKGIGDKEFHVDSYIIMTAVSVLFFSLVSLVIANVTKDMIPDWIFAIKILDAIISRGLQSILCKVITGITLILLIISFDSLVNYYLRSMRNKYFIDAIDEIIEERSKKKLK